jgi:GT2 family glycosyltransferase
VDGIGELMATKTFVSRTIARLPFPQRVDIVIPFHGQYEKVTRLVESIFRYTKSNVYTIILVDDCSPNEVFLNNLSKVPGVVTVRTEKQLGFGGALQAGFHKSEELNQARIKANKPRHPFMVFMHSDCIVEDINWLRSMGEVMLELKDQGVRMVSPHTDNPMGGDPRQKGEKGVHTENVILEGTHLSLYCFLCHRGLFKAINGFIKNYPFGFFEDEELAYRMRKYGFKQAIVGNSWIKHWGQSTIRELWRDKNETRKIMTEENRAKCIQDIRALNQKFDASNSDGNGKKLVDISESPPLDKL